MANYRYYLGPWILRRDPAPDTWTAPDGCAGWLDLATLPELETEGAERRLLVCWTAGELDSAYTLLGQGDCREIATTAKMRDAWESQTGYRPNGDTLVDLIWDQFTDGADPAGEDACKPLVPTRESNLELVMPGHSVVRRERFTWGQHKHTNKLQALLHRDLAGIRADSLAGKCKTTHGTDTEFHRSYLGGLVRKYNLTGDDWQLLIRKNWDKNDTPKKPGTTYTEDFNGANKATCGYDLTWTAQQGAFDNYNNAARQTDTRGHVRADHDLGASDNYAQAAVTSCADGAANYQAGVSARCASGSSTRYGFRLVRYFDPDQQDLYLWGGSGGVTSLGYNGENTSPTVTIKVDCNGSTITGYVGGTQKKQVTSTTYATGTRGGLYGYNVVTLDDFEASDGLSAATVKGRVIGGGVI